MKRIILAAGLLMTILFFMNSCSDDDVESPMLTVTPETATAWLGDEVDFSIVVSSESSFSVKVTNNYDSETFDNSYAAGETTVTYTYTMPNDVTDGQEIKLTFVATNSENGLATTVERIITASTEGNGTVITHEGTLTDDEVWSAANTHIIDGTLYLKGNTITIEPGTVIKFNSGAEIDLGYNSDASTALIAEGTVDKPITFTSANASPVAGDWDGIFIYEGTAPETSFKYCIFEYAGGYSDNSAIMDIEGNTRLTIDYCTFRYSSSNGLMLEDDETSLTSFTYNMMHDIAKHPIYLRPNNAGDIGIENVITATGTNGIYVESGTMDKSESTWKAQTVPFVIGGTMYIQSTTGSQLTIEPGTTVAFTNGAEFDIAYASDKYGTLIANGTIAAPIKFTSANASPVAGDWDGIFFYDGTSSASSFKNCTIEYGGGYGDWSAMIYAEGNASFTMESCLIQHSAAYGIILDDDNTNFVSFENNTMNEISEQFIQLRANAADGVGSNNNFQSVYSNKGIEVEGSTMDKSSATWLKQNVPYVISGTVYVQSTTGATLTIEAGTTVSFANGAEFDIAYASDKYGKIVAEGTDSEHITFTSAAPAGSESKGDWDAIFLYDGTSSGTVFDFCDFSYGGGYGSWSAMIYLDGTGSSVTITNSSFSNSESWAISYDAIDDNPTIINNTYSGNTSGDVNPR